MGQTAEVCLKESGFMKLILGIPEDPATGSANGNFAGWLAKYHYLGDS
jgi:predicted PhzF superfamily epimerase YddE/YHI9